MIEHVFAQVGEALKEHLGLDDNDVALVRDVVEVALVAKQAAHGHGELGDVMITADRVRSRFEGIAATPTARFQASNDWSEDTRRTPISWLAAHTGMSRDHAASLANTSATLLACPHALRSAQEGRLSPAKIRALLAVRTSDLLAEWTRQEAYLVATVETLTVAGAEVFLRSWQQATSPEDGNDKFKEDTDATQFHLSPVGSRFRADGQFDALSGATLQAAIEAKIANWRRDGELNDDSRTYAQLRAAALVELVAQGAGIAQPTRPSAMVLIDHDTLVSRSDDGTNMPYRSEVFGAGPIPADTIRRLMCNADITRVVMRGASEVLDVGRAQRLATPAIRKAVWARSGGRCEICHEVPASRCQIHHINPWEHGGETTLENSLLVCSHDHHLLHEGRHTVKRTADGYQMVRPDGSLPRLPYRYRTAA